MLLRDHPLLSYRGIPSWPPVWTWIEGEENKNPKGEIGTLIAVKLSLIEPLIGVTLSSATKAQCTWAVSL